MRRSLRIPARPSIAVATAALMLALSLGPLAQQPPAGQPGPPPAAPGGPPPNPNAAATAADHQNMMEQFGITRSARARAATRRRPNPANYDQAKANPYPESARSAHAEERRARSRRAEHGGSSGGRRSSRTSSARCSGACPKNVPKVTWKVTETRETTVGGLPVVGSSSWAWSTTRRIRRSRSTSRWRWSRRPTRRDRCRC